MQKFEWLSGWMVGWRCTAHQTKREVLGEGMPAHLGQVPEAYEQHSSGKAVVKGTAGVKR